MTGAELITELLLEAGVRSVFSVAGASHARLLACLDQAEINIVSCRHESGAVTAADGYARQNGGLGVALVISDQGLPNAIGGLAVAYTACSPVLLLVATPPVAYLETQPLIDHHKHELTSPISKLAKTVSDINRLEDSVGSAMSQAQRGRPGPAVLLLPQDLMMAPVSRRSSSSPREHFAPQADQVSIERAARWLAEAKRPLIIAGSGACRSGASDALHLCRDDFGLPVTGNGLGRGLVPEDWSTSFSWPFAQYAADQADVVLVVGARLTQRLGLGLPPRFASDARFIQIDIHAEEAHRNRLVDLFVHADAAHALSALLEALKAHSNLIPSGRISWLHSALAPRFEALNEIKSQETEPLHALHLGSTVAKKLPADAVVVGDGADIATWMYGAIAIGTAPGFMDHYPMGAMGTGTALAIGAATACRDAGEGRRTFLITGDGALGFHPAELHAAVLAQLDLTVIVGNDGAWGTEVHEQRKVIGREINTQLGALPYEQLAVGLGLVGLKATTRAELEQALEKALASPTPTLINVLIDPEAGAQLKADRRVRMIEFSDILEGFKQAKPPPE